MDDLIMFGFFKMGAPGSPAGMPPFTEFEKFRQLVLLWSVEQASADGKGITGYELKTLFNVPQTTVYRALTELENKKLVHSDELIVDGRAQKRFTLTDEGKIALDGLKKNVAGKITFLFEMLAPDMAIPGKGHLVEHFIAMFKNRMKLAGNKEEALALLDTFQDIYTQQQTMMQTAYDMMKLYYDRFLQFKKKVELMDEYDPDLMVELIEKEIQQTTDNGE